MIRDPMDVFMADPAFFSPTSTVLATATGKQPRDTAFPTIIPDPPIFERATAAGERTLWVLFVLMVLASVLFVILGWSVPASKRIFHHVTTLITITSALTYFALATHSGSTFRLFVTREKHDHGLPDTHHRVFRQVLWARYVEWIITGPLILIDLGLLAGISGASLSTAIVADIIMVLSALFASLSHRVPHHDGKTHGGKIWGWFAIAILSYLVIIYQLVINGRAAASARGSKVSKFFYSIAGYTILVWTAYPIVWAIADGKRMVSVNTEIIIFAVLDVLAKGVFGAWLLFTYRALPEAEVELGGFWAHGAASEGRIRIGEEDGA